MNLGEKLRQARLDAGLSQKALCGSALTRNMLSQIENGSAQPSMKTLAYLAGRLEKPMGYFLDETQSPSPNHLRILEARRCYDMGEWAGALASLQAYVSPDPVFDRERELLNDLSCLNLAAEAIRNRREPYARELLARVGSTAYCSGDILRRKYLLLGSLGREKVSAMLPSLDEELLMRSREALENGNLSRAAKLLEAVENQTPYCHLLRGRICAAGKQYARAAAEFQLAEESYPKETVPQLEACFRELGDYEKAYFYACKARD